MAHRRSLGFPGFPVEGCGFAQLHVVLFGENHISGTGESCEVGNPGTLGMTKRRGLLKGKGPLPRDRADVGRRGRLFHRHPLSSDGNRFCARAKKSQALLMTTDRVARQAPWYPTSREKRARCGAPNLCCRYRKPVIDLSNLPQRGMTKNAK